MQDFNEVDFNEISDFTLRLMKLDTKQKKKQRFSYIFITAASDYFLDSYASPTRLYTSLWYKGTQRSNARIFILITDGVIRLVSQVGETYTNVLLLALSLSLSFLLSFSRYTVPTLCSGTRYGRRL